METQNSTPRIYIADLAAYNSGILHGEWVDAIDANEIRETIARVLRNSPCPNVMVSCPECDLRAATTLFTSSHDKCSTCDGTGMVPSAEEWAIHDYDGFGNITPMLGEYAELETLAECGRMIQEHGDPFIAYIANVHYEHASADEFTDTYMGEYDSAADYVAEIHEGREIPDWLASYIDWKSMAHDWELGGDITVISTGHGTVYIFGAN